MSPVASKIEVRDLSKRFDVYHHPKDLLLELLTRRQRHEQFWALRNVSFSVDEGEVVGLMGRNGAGKSTLLKIVAGTVERTAGIVATAGRVSAILELGTGFNDARTGRENVHIGGLYLGMSRGEIEDKLPFVVEFSELGDFIDHPFKTYSSGMKARLTFSTAISTEPDILIIDEALAVGDAKFQRKCFAHLERLRSQGTTIFLVSHDARSISHLCDRVLLLEKGQLVFDGPPRDGIKEYHRMLFQEEVDRASATSAPRGCKIGAEAEVAKGEVRYGTREVEIVDVRIVADEELPLNSVRSGEPCTIVMRVCANADIDHVSYGFRLTTVEGTDIYGLNTDLIRQTVPVLDAGDEFDVRFAITCYLAPGRYFLTVAAARDHTLMYDRRPDILILEVLGPFQGYSSSLVDLGAIVSVEMARRVAISAEI